MDTSQAIGLCLAGAMLGYYFGRLAQAKDAEAADLRRRVWDLEADKRRAQFDADVKAGKIPPPVGVPMGAL